MSEPLPTDEASAVAMQNRLRPFVDPTNAQENPMFHTVAGLDCAYDEHTAAGAVVVLDSASLVTIDTASARGACEFPYVSGLLAFRELPVALAALEALGTTPDLLICDGQGLAHPRRFGLACHVGVLTGLPSIGVAKTPWGHYLPPDRIRGGATDITIDGEVVGRALRTRTGVKPVFVSVGHRIDLNTACAQVLALTSRYRLPETTRRADHLCRTVLRQPGPLPGKARSVADGAA